MSASSTAGYTCYRCGTFVPEGVTHACIVQNPPPVQPSQTTWANPYDLVLQRIAGGLERIAAALEAKR